MLHYRHSHRRPTLLLTIILLLALALPVGSPVTAHPGAERSLYIATVSPAKTYTPLDPLTLQDLPGAAITLPSETDPYSYSTLSTDGSTFAFSQFDAIKLAYTIIVTEVLTGTTFPAITLGYEPLEIELSASGGRLIVEVGGYSRAWQTWDTRSGKLLSTVSMANDTWLWSAQISPDATRFYDSSVFKSAPPTSTGPWPLQITSYDLLTGAEIGRIEVPGVMAGSWVVDNDHTISTQEQPAIVLSPDGSTLAVVDTGLETLTLIDAETLEIRTQHPIREPATWYERLLTWLGVLPQSAAAKLSGGRTAVASWSADGRTLYVAAETQEISVDPDAETTGEYLENFVFTGSGTGVLAVEVSTGHILGKALTGEDVGQLIPSPDGQSVYVIVSHPSHWTMSNINGDWPKQFTLHRLDATTLESTTTREFKDWVGLRYFPMSP